MVEAAEPHGPLLAVTTRSRLRSVRFFPAMLLATRRVRRQLARTEGVECWASMVAGPTEFWTVTVWRSRHAMQEFTRSEAHGEIMWRFSRWLSSLWLMRWRPGPHERGSWSGRTLKPEDATASGEQAPSWPVLATSLESLPELASAVGKNGVATWDSSVRARRDRLRVAGAAAVVIRIHTRRRRAPAAAAELRRLRRQLASDPQVLRTVTGLGRPGEAFFLGVWADHDDAVRFLQGEWTHTAVSRWDADFFAAAWLPENEFGHWDGLRVRRERSHQARSARDR